MASKSFEQKIRRLLLKKKHRELEMEQNKNCPCRICFFYKRTIRRINVILPLRYHQLRTMELMRVAEAIESDDHA